MVGQGLEAMKPPRGAMHVVGHGVWNWLGLRTQRKKKGRLIFVPDTEIYQMFKLIAILYFSFMKCEMLGQKKIIKLIKATLSK